MRNDWMTAEEFALYFTHTCCSKEHVKTIQSKENQDG